MTIILSNISLDIAQEQNLAINAFIRESVLKGAYKVLFPNVISFKTNLPGSSQNIALRLDSSNGLRLQKIYHTVYNNDETKNLAYNHWNNNDIGQTPKIDDYYTELDGVRLQQDDYVNCNTNDDYKLHKNMLKGTAIINKDVYKYNWFVCDDFTGLPPLSERKYDIPDENMEVGVDLTAKELTYKFIARKPNNSNLNHYTFVITQNELTISPTLIQVSKVLI